MKYCMITTSLWFGLIYQTYAVHIDPNNLQQAKLNTEHALLLTIPNVPAHTDLRLELSSANPLLEPEILESSQGIHIITEHPSTHHCVLTIKAEQEGAIVLKLTNSHAVEQLVNISSYTTAQPSPEPSKPNIILTHKVTHPFQNLKRKWFSNCHLTKGQIGRYKGRKIRLW